MQFRYGSRTVSARASCRAATRQVIFDSHLHLLLWVQGSRFLCSGLSTSALLKRATGTSNGVSPQSSLVHCMSLQHFWSCTLVVVAWERAHLLLWCTGPSLCMYVLAVSDHVACGCFSCQSWQSHGGTQGFRVFFGCRARGTVQDVTSDNLAMGQAMIFHGHI